MTAIIQQPAEPSRNAPLVDSTALLGDGNALRARGAADGYLFFKNLLPATDVTKVRADLLSVVEKHGWRPPGLDSLDGAIDTAAMNRVPDEAMRLDIGVSIEAYHDAQKLESVHRLPHHPRLLDLYRTLFAGEVLVHPRHIIRMVTGHDSMVPTPHHQDFPLIQGTSNTWTCWFAVGDCPSTMGGLAVLRGSHRTGYIPVKSTRGAGGIAAQLCRGETDWASAEYEAGDVLTFPSFTVHRALKCLVKDQIRLSFDVRHQPLDEEVESRSLLPHCELSWEEIYADWEQDDLKYYWKNLPLKMSDWNDTLMQPSRRIC